jgi:hypothetical protein
MKKILFAVIAIGMLPFSHAATIETQLTGLDSLLNIVNFDELSFPSYTGITDQSNAFGINLDGFFYVVPGLLRNCLQGCVDQIHPTSIHFTENQTDAAALLVWNGGNTRRVDALLDGVFVESFTPNHILNDKYYFGFTDFLFNEMKFYRTDTSASSITLYQVQFGIAPVPIPATLWLFGSALGLLGWRVRKLPQ